MSSLELIGQIYEAVGSPELWPAALENLADAVGAIGAGFVYRTSDHTAWTFNPRMEEIAAAYLEEGWLTRDDRVPPVLTEHFPGFRVDPDYWTEAQARELPIYRDFLLPRGLKASAACLIQGSKDDALHIAIEGLASYSTARSAVPLLNQIRPHLARSLSLTGHLTQTYEKGVADGLEAAGVGAAVVSSSGRLRVANETFGKWFNGNITDLVGNVRFSDTAANQQLGSILDLESQGVPGGRSFPVTNGTSVAALHCIPLRGRSREVFEAKGFVLLLARPGNRMVPTADLLRLLFDLTPAEARLARLIAQGKTVAEAAQESGIQPNTVRIHLKAVYAKTGFSGQSELAVSLSSLGSKDDLVSDDRDR